MRGNPMTIKQLQQRLGMKPKPKLNPPKSLFDKPKPKQKMVEGWLKDDNDNLLKITQAEHDEISGYAKKLVQQAEAADDLVTSQIKGIADDVKAAFPDAPTSTVEGSPIVKEGSLHWRMKDLKSTSRKIQTYARDRNLTFAEAQGQISDSLRFTYIVDEADYIDAVRATMQRFAELGYKNGKFDAAWFKRPDYRGLNINMVTPEGVKMELQFHTAKSFEIKNGINHKLYEQFRQLSKAKQKGPEGQAFQAAMKKNADTIPMPPRIKELDKLAKKYDKPSPAAQQKILDDAKESTQISKAQKDFETQLNQYLDEGNIGKATIHVGKSLDLLEDIPEFEAVVKQANDRIAAVRTAQTKKLDDVMEQLSTITDQDEFYHAAQAAKKALEPGIQQQLSKAVDDLFKKKQTGDFTVTRVNRAIEEGDLLFAQQQLNQYIGSISVRKELTQKIRKLEKAAVEEAKEVFSLLDGLEVKTQVEYANWVKSIRSGIKTKAGDKEFMKLVNEGEKKVRTKIKIQEAQVAIDAGDFEEAKALLATVEGKEVNSMSLKIANMTKAVSEGAKTYVDDLAKLHTTPEALTAAVEVALKNAQPTFKLFAKNHLSAALDKLENIKLAKIKNFPKQVEQIAVKELGFAVDDLAMLPTSLEDMALFLDGVITDGFKVSLRQQLGAARVQLREAMDGLKALNKSSKGVDALTDLANKLPLGVKTHPEFQAVIKKVTQQAQKKANAARQDVISDMLKAGKINATDVGLHYDSVFKDALKEVNKKLGPAQKKAKMAEIEAKLAQVKKGNVQINSFEPIDFDDYTLIVNETLGTQTKAQLDEAVRLFRENANSQSARSKLFDTLGNASNQKEIRAIKEYVHQRVNPKTLPNGMNFDEVVAQVVSKNANNAPANEIQMYIDAMLKGGDANLKINLHQTIFTRANVKSIDALGVTPAGEATPAVLRIREQLKKDGDPADIPLPVHSAEEIKDGAKYWLNSKNLPDEEFRAQALRQSKAAVSKGKGVIKAGDNKFGPNSWGITPDEWDDWAKNVAPTLDPWDVAILEQYTGGMAGQINAGLYNGGTEFVNTAGARAVNAAIDKMPKFTGEAYRGTSARAGWNADYIDARYQVGETVTERGFGSSATQESASFSGPLRFYIKAKGKQGAIMGHIGGYGTGEMEVLFKAGSRFRVVQKQRTANGIKVWMEEV
jgi:hypothetical protein